jgi:hypothetical protein
MPGVTAGCHEKHQQCNSGKKIKLFSFQDQASIIKYKFNAFFVPIIVAG